MDQNTAPHFYLLQIIISFSRSFHLCDLFCPSSLFALLLFLSEDAAVGFNFYLIGHSLHMDGWPQDGGRAKSYIIPRFN